MADTHLYSTQTPLQFYPKQNKFHPLSTRAIEDQAAEAVRDLALAELELPVGAEVATSKLIPLLEWSTLAYDKLNDQVRTGCYI